MIPLFILFYFLFGTTIVGDYGISWDEYQQREIGVRTFDYLLGNSEALSSFNDRDYGVAFELILVSAEKVFHLKDLRDIYLMRHFLTFLFWVMGVWAFGQTLYLLFKDRFISFFGMFMLILSPHLFSHSFYNSKDTILLSSFFLLFYFQGNYITTKKRKDLFFLSLVLLWSLEIRLVSLFFFFTTLFFIKKRKEMILFTLLIPSLFFLLHPALKMSDIPHLFTSLLRFRWEDKMIFQGEWIYSTHLPWNYLITSFIVTTPLFYLFLGCLGIYQAIKLKKNPYLLHILLFGGVHLAFIVLRPVAYDSWRHFYFSYSSFLFLASLGAFHLFKKLPLLPKTLLFILPFLLTANTMKDLHPYQHIYFNEWVMRKGEALKEEYELDYWGTAYREALLWMVAHDFRPFLKVYGETKPAILNTFLLPKEQREKIIFVSSPQEAYYYMTNYRYHKKPLPLAPAYEVKRGPLTILSLYKIQGKTL